MSSIICTYRIEKLAMQHLLFTHMSTQVTILHSKTKATSYGLLCISIGGSLSAMNEPSRRIRKRKVLRKNWYRFNGFRLRERRLFRAVEQIRRLGRRDRVLLQDLLARLLRGLSIDDHDPDKNE